MPLILRQYPPGVGHALLKSYLKSCKGPFRRDLRKKYELDETLTDRQLFEVYPLVDDQWFDASLAETFFYLYGCSSLCIPDSWQSTMETFKNQLVSLVAP